MSDALVTIITPTTGKDGLFRLIESLDKQTVSFQHILLWDDKREDKFLYPDPVTFKSIDPCTLNGSNRYSVVIKGSFVQGKASGSALRAIGLMLATTPYVSFADDDVWYEQNHLENMLNIIKDKNWAYCRRKIWNYELNLIDGTAYAENKTCIGIDNFESVGDSPDRKVAYEMVDNNCMIFNRRYGTSASVLYRETQEYNDDRLMYNFLKQYAGVPGKTSLATVNQICPDRLLEMFKQHCTKV